MNLLEYLSRNYPLHILLGFILFALILAVVIYIARKMLNGYYLDRHTDENFFDWLNSWFYGE